MNILASVARRWLWNSEHENADGQALVEYSLILALIIIACLLVLTQTGEVVRDNLWAQTSNLPFWD